MALNVCAFTGRLGKDPEMKYLQSGTAVTNFSLAVNLSQDNTMWLDVAVWGKQAEAVNEHLSKGDMVGVSGRLVQDVWEDEGGNRRTKIKVTASRVEFLTPKKSDSSGPTSVQPKEQAESQESPAPSIDVPDDSAFPF